MMRVALIIGLFLLAGATWVNEVAAADAVIVFAAFVIGGLWGKQADEDV